MLLKFFQKKQCKNCKHFMARRSYRLGYSMYLNNCSVLITQSDFYCSDYMKRR